MLLEDLRNVHEDLERLESAISTRYMQDPVNIRQRLHRDHEVAGFLDRFHSQSKRLKGLYESQGDLRQSEVERIGTGDTFAEFYKELQSTKEFHRKYPDEPLENLERAYQPRTVADGESAYLDVDNMFSGEEAFGRYFDLVPFHEQFLNLKGLPPGRRMTYLQYIDNFDGFNGTVYQLDRKHKLNDEYFKYVKGLAIYLESFLKRTRPMEDFETIFAGFENEFSKAWDEKKVKGWQVKRDDKHQSDGPVTEGTGTGVWCADCGKEFSNENTYKSHLSGKKHIKAAKERAENGDAPPAEDAPARLAENLRERAIAEREFRIMKLAHIQQEKRHDTKANLERRAGMTEKERQAERDALAKELEMTTAPAQDEAEDDTERIYNPLKLPLNWDGRPIPYWLYKLHGLGVEFSCEICGGFVYHGRRAYEKHFSEPRHTWGLRCLGIKPDVMFREIQGIEEARQLQAKVEANKKEKKASEKDIEEMEDSLGNVMPRKVYEDLQAAGLV